jgi:hypothetical protein
MRERLREREREREREIQHTRLIFRERMQGRACRTEVKTRKRERETRESPSSRPYDLRSMKSRKRAARNIFLNYEETTKSRVSPSNYSDVSKPPLGTTLFTPQSVRFFSLVPEHPRNRPEGACNSHL